MENPRLHDYDEPASMVMPADDIACVDCLLRLKDHGRFKYANCKAFPMPGVKPLAVLFHGGECDYYVRDPEGSDEVAK